MESKLILQQKCEDSSSKKQFFFNAAFYVQFLQKSK
jgi:hypothetical protein